MIGALERPVSSAAGMNAVEPVRADIVEGTQRAVKIVHHNRLAADITAYKIIVPGNVVPEPHAAPNPTKDLFLLQRKNRRIVIVNRGNEGVHGLAGISAQCSRRPLSTSCR